MNVQTEKIELAKRLLETEDEMLIQQVKAVFDSYQSESSEVLPDHVKIGIQKSQQQAADGLLIPHEDVMKRYNRYL